MVTKCAPRDLVVAEAPALVLRLPVCLKQDITSSMGDKEREQS
jgi:hypothetical protein